MKVIERNYPKGIVKTLCGILALIGLFMFVELATTFFKQLVFAGITISGVVTLVEGLVGDLIIGEEINNIKRK